MRRGSFDQVLMPLPSVCQPSGHCPLLLRAFKPAVCQPSNFQTPKTLQMLRGSFNQALMPLPSAVKGVQACRLPAVRPLPSVVKRVQACRLPAVRPLPSVVRGVQACRLPALKPLKPLKCSAAASTRYSCHCPLFASRKATALCCC